MVEITQNIFEIVNTGFNKLYHEKIDESKIDFKNHPVAEKHENYKYEIIEDAKNALLQKTWKENDIGSGTILRNVKNAINVKSNNLIDWRKKDDFKKLKANKETEKFLFDFFKSKIDDKIAFNSFIEIGFSYQLIAYLFFVKNHQKYMPISQEKFDEIFSSTNIDFKTSHNCSWENYLEYNDIIKQFRKLLSHNYQSASLLDAHSFLWVYGFQLEEPKVKSEQKKERQRDNIIKEKSIEKPKPELETYKPEKAVDLETLVEPESEIDYIEQLKKQMEIGDLAEQIVINSEQEFLGSDFPDLANKVRSVANNPQLGFDIISFETDGTQKQIEVKGSSITKSNKSFFLSKNELNKSKAYPNYYLYYVTELNADKPKILRIKHPDFENENEFKMESMTYKITFK